MIYPWHTNLWTKLQGRRDRLPHALLLAGPEGLGKRRFAEVLARGLLCEQPSAEGFPCGRCVSCGWVAAATHPDLRLLSPESEAEDAASEAEAESLPATKKKASNQILIEQLRALTDFASLGTHRGGYRVVLVDPAEAMNAYTANALLKLLEEPNPSTLFLMVSHAPRRLLATIRSRCQTLSFSRPDPQVAAAWLRQRTGSADVAGVLAFCGGMPLAAQTLAGTDASACREQFLAAIQDPARSEPLRVAALWEGWCKRKPDAGFACSLPMLADWMQRWVFDLALWKSARRVTFHPGRESAIERLVAGVAFGSLAACYNELLRIKGVAEHPLNPRLFLEDMLLKYGRAVATGGTIDG
jgi:DNA polymerase-3 subunit delta'